MALTGKFKNIIQQRVQNDQTFRQVLLVEAVNKLFAGDCDAAKVILRDYINATITFPRLAQELNKSSKSIHRMLGLKWNPRFDSITGILKMLQDKECVRLEATSSSNRP